MTATSSVRVDDQSNLCVVHVSGDLDLAAVSHVVDLGSSMIETTSAARVAVDMAGVSFIDSCGIGALVALCNTARGRNLPFRVVAVPLGVRRVLELAGMCDALGVAHV
jgi:anti-sigma B factor antagonist